MPPEKTSFTYKLTDVEQGLLTDLLLFGNYRPLQVPHTSIAAETPDCRIHLYTSGKCLVQGKGAQDFVTFVLEPVVLQRAGVGYEEVLTPEAFQPHMGVDESGKGDFFGPLVVVAAYVDKQLVKAMQELGVKDSKNITSDAKALSMGRDIRKLLGKRFAVVKIGPHAYNRLYAKMHNVNTLLAWAHARAIENLLETVPSCPLAISDQFGKKEQVERALMKKGQNIELVQRHKAESDMAVAAASVVARELFLRGLKDISDKYETEIPKGASDIVRTVAIDLAKNHGPDILLETVKCHFKTTDTVLQELKLDRSALGPEGQVVSKAKTWSKRKKKT